MGLLNTHRTSIRSALNNGSLSSLLHTPYTHRRLLIKTTVLAIALIVGVTYLSTRQTVNSNHASRITSSTQPLVLQHNATNAVSSNVNSPSTTENSSQTNSTAPGTASHSSSNLSVDVNGKAISVPANGTTQQTVSNSGGGTSSVTVTHNDSGNGVASNLNTVTNNVNISSSSSSSTNSSSDVNVESSQ